MIAGVFIVGPLLRSPEQAAADALPPQARPVLVKAETRELTERIIFRSAIVAGKSVPLFPTAALVGKGGVITDVPLGSGSRIAEGGVVLEVSGEPVFAMNWPFRAYRDMQFGDSGPDVAALQKTLASLGYGTSLNGTFDWPTENGLAQFYIDRGYFAPKSSASGSMDDTAAKGSSAENTSSDTSSKPEVAKKQTAPLHIYLPSSHVARIASPTHTVTSVEVPVGAEVSDPAKALYLLDGEAGMGLAAVTGEQAAKLAVGTKAEVKDNRDGKTHPVTVTSVAKVTADVPGVGQGFRVEFSFDTAFPSVTPEGTTVMVTAQVGSDLGKVLAAPVSGVYSKADGESFVSVSRGGATTDVPVGVGKSLGGWIQITPLANGGVVAGDQLVVGNVTKPDGTP